MRLLFFLLIAWPAFLRAQYDDLLRKKRYTWVAEYTCDYELNPIYNEWINYVHVIRLENPEGWNGLIPEFEIPYYLSGAILKGIVSGKFVCFRDSTLTQRLPYLEIDSLLVRKDTFVSICDGEIKVNKTEISPNQINLFRVRQVFFYDSRKQIFGSRLLAVAPVVNIYDPDGNFQGRQPLLWIKIPAQDAFVNQKQIKSSNYIFQTFMEENAPKLETIKTVKGRLDLKKWATDEVRSPTSRLYSCDKLVPVDKAVLQKQVFTNDTIALLDTVIMNDIDRIENICFVQQWYYNERRHRLAMHIVAVAPSAAFRDLKGYQLPMKPLFYSKY